MKTKDVQGLLIEIARRDVGLVEKTRNQAPWIEKFWPKTSYPDGHKNREPYCAAACVCWLFLLMIELAKRGQLVATFGMTSAQFEKWRCKSARAFDWRDWGRKAKGVKVLGEGEKAQPGDFVVFDFSHIGLVVEDKGATILTIEANTNNAGSRDGDGCWEKARKPRSLVQCFVRVIPEGL